MKTRHIIRLFCSTAILTAVSVSCIKESEKDDGLRKQRQIIIDLGEHTRGDAINDASQLDGKKFGIVAFYPQGSTEAEKKHLDTYAIVKKLTENNYSADLYNGGSVSTYYWPLSDNATHKLNFIGWYPYEGIGAPVMGTKDAVNQKVPLTFIVDENMSSQVDLMYALKSPTWKTSVSLQFKHALTRVTFHAQIDGFPTGSVVKLKKLEVNGIHNKGVAEISNEAFEWKSKETVNDPVFTMDFSGNLLTLGTSNVILNPAVSPAGADNMFVLPHTKAELENAAITVTVLVDDVEKTYKATKIGDLYSSGWIMGESVNYLINIKPDEVIPDVERVGESNCYMIKNGDVTPLLIPVSQVKYAMNGTPGDGSGFLGSDWVTNYNNLKAQVFWSDINVFDDIDAVVESVEYIGNGASNFETLADAKILVTPGIGKGNAGIILYEDNDSNPGYQQPENPEIPQSGEDRIIWSWHIWNSDYYPYDEERKADGRITSSNLSLLNGTWMDRNLGAMSNAFVDPASEPQPSVGLMYQWGRKDPFPGSLNLISDYTLQTYYHPSDILVRNSTFEHSNNPNLKNAVQNPLTRYVYDSTPKDWFTATGIQNNNLWGGANKTDLFLHTGGNKSVYDPCPEGYRIPKHGIADGFVSIGWEVVENAGRIHHSYGGYYPFAGYRAIDDFIGVGKYGEWWMASTTGVYGYILDLAYNGNTSGSSRYSRNYLLSVRCRAE